MKTTPRQLFRLRHQEEASRLEVELTEPWLQHSIAFTLAEMAASGKGAEISGANEFLKILASLPVNDPEMRQQPDPVLKTYEPGYKPPTDVPK